MGWLYGWTSKESLIADLRSPSRFSSGIRLVQSSVRGKRHWYLAERADGSRWIGLDLMDRLQDRIQWGFKDLDETVGPFYFDCPISYIKAATQPFNESAAIWRGKVLALAREKRTRMKPSPEQEIALNGTLYTLKRLASPSRPRLGWVVTDNSGKEWRLPIKLLSIALRESTPEVVAELRRTLLQAA